MTKRLNDATPQEWDAAWKAAYNEEVGPAKPTDTQVGGSHYKDMAIQPVDFCLANNIGFCEANVIKYICRYKSKGGIDDLRKAKHYIDIIMGQYNESN